MVLSRVALDITKRATVIALQNPAMFHGAIERSFEPRSSRTLWRIDVLHGQHYLLLLSEGVPELNAFAAQFGTDDAVETRDYEPLLARIGNGSSWQFRLCANPTYSKAMPNGRGMVCAHKTPEHQRRWLMEQAAKHGFALTEEEFAVTNSQWYTFGKATGDKVKLLSVTYEGMLTVTDSSAFCEVLKNGIGRGKAYGMGLLTIIRR